MTIETLTLDCRECGGTGTELVGPICWKPASDCCGGCYQEENCVYCDGDGLVVYGCHQYPEHTNKVIRIYNRLISERIHPKFIRGIENLIYEEIKYNVECKL